MPDFVTRADDPRGRADVAERRPIVDMLAAASNPTPFGRSERDPLEAALDITAAEAAARGMTEADLEAELAAYNAERRD